MRILEISSRKELEELMQEIKVDPYGIKIMAPKAISYLLRINSLSNITANILKQEMLSLGADAAIARDALTGKSKKTDCLLMGTQAEFNRLKAKIDRQPFGLRQIAKELSGAIENYERNRFVLNLGRFRLDLSRPKIMGIVNLTPDSFSGDGVYRVSRSKGIKASEVLNFVERMVRDGADIIDVGGESSRPGAKPISVKEELARTQPVIKILAKKIKVPISIDTYKPEVARQALDCGVSIVNDITGLRNPKMASLVARYRAGVVIMHMKGTPRTMQQQPVYKSLIDEIIEYLSRAIERASEVGIKREKIIIDPGIGFGKTLEHNLEILKRLKEFKILGQPILVGTSRKSFLGKILGVGPQERIFGTVSSCILAIKNGAHILRVHDVKEVKQALKVAVAIMHA
ncbi:MAG: dihydropteroate synthase [Candidatus Omnitrophica bacterium]|nr:dihydropteroate synthase [Candidatus Omnitrophota bacterium]